MRYADEAVAMLSKKSLHIATAESCTGGLIASELVAYAGISALFDEGYVTYSNEAKMRLLGVKQDTLATKGAVSAECAEQMAYGARKMARSDIGLATTGIAGPSGGSKDKPVGTVYIACAYRDKIITKRYCFSGSRMQIRLAATKMAFHLVTETIRRVEKAS